MASTDVQSQISALRAEIAALQKDLGERGTEAYETIRDRAGNAGLLSFVRTSAGGAAVRFRENRADSR